jgi:2-keto-3-deoxy-6-phosphogluconate aldolase
LRTIEEAAAAGRDILIGAGTVLDSETAGRHPGGSRIHRGADSDPNVIELCHRYDKVVIPGAFRQPRSSPPGGGADFVKVFPAQFGAGLLESGPAPLPQVKLIPVGAFRSRRPPPSRPRRRLGVGSNLVDKKLVADVSRDDPSARAFGRAVRGERSHD